MENSTATANGLAKEWLGGKQDAWPKLKLLIQNNLADRIIEFFPELDGEELNKVKILAMAIFEDLLSRGILRLNKRDHFTSMCAYSLRHVLVEIAHTHQPPCYENNIESSEQ